MTAIQSGAQVITDAMNKYANGKWDSIILVTVGNEFANTQKYTVSARVDALNRARENLTNVHYTGPVGIVDTVPAVTDNPALCENSDYALVSCHASSIPTQLQQVPALLLKARSQTYSKLVRMKKVIVMESG